MSERFGLSHRQVVRDVNEGKVVPPVDEAVTSRRGVSGGPSTQVIRSDDGSRRLVESLLKAGGVVADKMSAEAKRKAKIEGYNMAGTEEGRAAADEMGQTLNVKLFGPGAKLRSAQERIAQDQTDDNIAKLRSDLDDFGHKMTEAEWREHTDTQLASMTDKFEDEGLKDLITERFGRNIQAVKRDYEKQSKTFIQAEERETYVNSIHTGAKMAQADLASGDPQRQEDAEVRLTEALMQPEGMSDEAYRSAVAAAVKNELVNGRSGLFDVAKSSGILEELTYEDTQELEQAKLLHDAKNDEDFIIGMKQLEYLADTEGNIEQVTALAKKLQAQNPAVFGSAGISTVVERAFDRQMEIQAEAARRSAAESLARQGTLPGDMDVADKHMAVEDAIYSAGEDGVRAEMEEELAKQGKSFESGTPIPQEAVSRWLLDNPEKTVKIWADNNVVLDSVKHAGSRVLRNLGRADINEVQALQLKNDLASLGVMRSERPELWAKHFTAAEGARLVEYNQQMNSEGADPLEVVARMREIERLQDRGLVYVPTEEQSALGKEEVAESFVREHGEWSFNPIRHSAALVSAGATAVVEGVKAVIPFVESDSGKVTIAYKNMAKLEPELFNQINEMSSRYYDQAFARTGNPELSAAEAAQRLNRSSIVIGGKAILDGAKLDDGSFGNSFDRYLEGLNDDPTWRALAIDGKKGYGLDADFNLRSGFNRIIPNPDGSGAMIMIKGADGTEKPVTVLLPTRAEQILPTAGEQRIEAIRENLLESRVGGSFGAQFEEAKQQPN